MGNHAKIITEFLNVVDSIHGVYLDSTLGFKLVTEYILKIQNKSIKLIGSKATIDKLDEAEFIYGTGSPPKYKDPLNPSLLHITTQGELKERNKKDGINFKVIGNLTIVQIYQFWEDKYRDEIAKSMNLQKDDLKSDIFGELRQIRASIIHNNSIVTSDCEKKVKIVNFGKGEEIFLKQNDVHGIVNAVKSYLRSL